MKLAVVVGTRPEVIKMSPVLREIERLGLPYVLIHSNQHYSSSMDDVFFKELKLPAPQYNLNVGSGKHSNQTGNILIKIEPILEKERPDVVLVQGDTNTVLAAAMAAAKLDIPVGHVEAGLRSYDRTMPEETNRVITDHLSRWLFAVSETQRNILHQEGIKKDHIHVVGNTIADALYQNLELAKSQAQILRTLGLQEKGYFLFTAHRSSNVDYEKALRELVEVIEQVGKHYKQPVVWPIHPRTLKKLSEFKIELPKSVITTEPLGYFDFLILQKGALAIFTDSGGVQEEACILGVPCLTLRENTERPETIHVGANVLVGRNVQAVLKHLESFLVGRKSWASPFGEGKSAEAILQILCEDFGLKKVQATTFKPKTISVIGLGYMGLPTASLLANSGHRVRGIDLIQEKVDSVNRGDCPFEEPGLKELVAKAVHEGGLKASTKLEPSDVYIIAVPTPAKDRKCDLSYVVSAAESVAKVARDGDLVILESTVRPGTCDQVLAPLFKKHGKSILLAHCPERAIPGNTLHELIHNDRMIGGTTDEATEKAVPLYKTFVKGQIFQTQAKVAEAAKLMENTFRDVNIALANEFAEICRELGIDVFEAIALANKHPRVNILSPGPGVGGHCIAVDPWFLVEKSHVARLIKVARTINEERPHVIVLEVQKELQKIGGRKVGVLGVAYKKNVDDCRETPAQAIIEELLEKEVEIKVYDPHVKNWIYPLAGSFQEVHEWADLLLIVTDHDLFKGQKYKKPVIDPRNCLV